MEFETIEVSAHGAYAVISLNRPEKLNALGAATLHELTAAAHSLAADAAVKVVVLAGRGRAFSAGADLGVFADAEGGTSQATAEAGRRMVDAVAALPAVTVARLHGHCVGGAVVLATACDLRVAAAGTTFAIPEVQLGIPLAWGGIPRLVREIGPAWTRDLVLTGRRLDAEEAHAIGLVTRVVAVGEIDVQVDRLVGDLLARPVLALRTSKRQLDAAVEALVCAGSGWVDAALLSQAIVDPEARAAAAGYLRSRHRPDG